ncbi:hypothetical protein ACJ72_08209, partial [Emergomyces africanus]
TPAFYYFLKICTAFLLALEIYDSADQNSGWIPYECLSALIIFRIWFSVPGDKA